MLKNIKGSLVTDIKQLIDGMGYIEVKCYYGTLSMSLGIFVGTPDLVDCEGPRGPESMWFGQKLSLTQMGLFDQEFSLEYLNVVPNSYNNHTLWLFTAETRKCLADMVRRGEEGYLEYVALIGEFGRGGYYLGWNDDLDENQFGADDDPQDLMESVFDRYEFYR